MLMLPYLQTKEQQIVFAIEGEAIEDARGSRIVLVTTISTVVIGPEQEEEHERFQDGEANCKSSDVLLLGFL